MQRENRIPEGGFNSGHSMGWQSAESTSENGIRMKWLITGGCGFIGTSLIRNLSVNGGHQIGVIDNLSVGTRKDLAGACQFEETQNNSFSNYFKDNNPHSPTSVCLIVRDIRDESLAIDLGRGADIIVHLAANTGVGHSVEEPRKDCIINVLGTFNYLESARHNRVKRFIFASSGASIGESDPPIHEEKPAHPVSPYGASKLAGEAYCSAYFRTYGVESIVLRFGNVYGPGSDHKNSVIAKFIKQAINGEVLEIYGDGKQTRDFIYIDDLIQAIQLASTTPNIGGEIFQIANNSETTIGEVLELLLKEFASRGLQNIRHQTALARLGGIKRNFSDIAKARAKLNWAPKYDLKKGLWHTIEYFEHFDKNF